MKSALALGTLVFGLLLGGCASVISGSSQTLTVNSDVPGAQVYLNNQLLGTTPLSVKIKRGQEGTLRVEKPGHTPYMVSINKKINVVFWVNIFSLGFFGSSTDYSTGAMYEYEPDTYFATLRPSGSPGRGRYAWRRRNALRAFVLLNGEALVSDLAAGDGEHVDVLLHFLDVKPERRDEAIERWRDSYAASDTALQFSNLIVAELSARR